MKFLVNIKFDMSNHVYADASSLRASKVSFPRMQPQIDTHSMPWRLLSTCTTRSRLITVGSVPTILSHHRLHTPSPRHESFWGRSLTHHRMDPSSTMIAPVVLYIAMTPFMIHLVHDTVTNAFPSGVCSTDIE